MVLSEIIKAFEQAGGPVELNELGRSLGVERSALEGMLELLVRQGKLREISLGSETCAHCSNRSGCTLLRSGSPGSNVYELPDQSV